MTAEAVLVEPEQAVDECVKIRAYPLRHHANEGKLAQVRELLSPWRLALDGMLRQLRRRMLDGQPLTKRMQTKSEDLDFETVLSARQVKSIYNQTHAALASWQGSMKSAVKETITGSSLPDEDKTVLYRVNARKGWFVKELTLPMSLNVKTGEVIHGRQSGGHWKAAEDLVVEPRLLKLLRHMVKHLSKRLVRFPDLSRVNSMAMDGPIAKITKADPHSRFDYWIRVSTLNQRKPVRIPLRGNEYFREATGELSSLVQVTITWDGSVRFTLQKKSEPAKLREDNGNWLGLDWGMTHLFATSDGHLFGQGALPHLRELDRQATELQKALQRQNIPRKTNKRYRKFQRRIREYIKNEVNRILNKVTVDNLAGVAVENLDFRGGGMSKAMNRLITRFGRAAVKSKLGRLQQDRGLNVIEVNATLTSQQCSGCGHINEKNRSRNERTKFLCRFCGKKIHADINASRTIRSRRSWLEHGGSATPRQRMRVRDRLDSDFKAHWGMKPPPTAHATGNRKAGSRRRSAVRLARSF